jgi:UDP-N-acetylmuramoylalanine--D-glutamate ligase
MTLEALALQGRNHIHNSMAATIGERILEIRKDVIKDSLSDFQHIEHRLECVSNVHGIEFINDSRATNVNSAWFALESMCKPIIWIAGGVDKGNDYSLLIELVKKKVKTLICLGADNAAMISNFIGLVPQIYETLSMQDAVQLSYNIGKQGDAVLLSPACPSFDLFENYEQRGEAFIKAVKSL